ncbi:MAG TPA: rod shape-determining protein MreD [Clostridiales bacterium]|nr:rod shape-determining protein MreD [Clostridiales bacterium]
MKLKQRMLRLLPIIILLSVGLFQNTPAGNSLFLLIPCITTFACFRGEYASLFFGIFAGLMWDFSSTAPDGLYTLILAFSAVFVSVMVKKYFRKTLRTSLFFGGIGLLIFGVVISIVYAHSFGSFMRVFFVDFFFRLLLSFATIPLFYMMFRQRKDIYV